MTSANDSDANKEASPSDEKANATIEQPVISEHGKTGEEPADASFEAPLIVDEDKRANTDATDDGEIDGTGHNTSESDSEASDGADMDTQPLLEQSVILEGKRSRRPTVRLELAERTPAKKEFTIPQGRGQPLGKIEYINHQITHASTDGLSRMHAICFGHRGTKTNSRKHLREFNGFAFNRHSDEYDKHLNSLTKLKKDQLRTVSNILGLPSTGRNHEHAERILKFLMEPTDEGKQLPKRKSAARKKKSKVGKAKKENGTDTHENDLPKRTKGAPGKSKVQRDESFSEDEEEEEVETTDQKEVSMNETG